MRNVILSAHGKERIKERCGKSSDKIALNSKERGIHRELTTGRLYDYLLSLYYAKDFSPNIYVYQNKVFIFDKAVLVTVLNLPTNLHKQAEAQIKKYNERKAALN